MTDSGPGAGRAVNADGGPPPSRATPSRTPVLGPGAPSSRSVRFRAEIGPVSRRADHLDGVGRLARPPTSCTRTHMAGIKQNRCLTA